MTALTDTLARPLRDLRISVTDRCNFRCTYCMPKEVFGHDFVFLRREQLLTFEEIERLARLFLAAGVTKIRLTGGEPLLRRDLETLVSMLSALRPHGLADLTLTTNGALLPAKAGALRDAGLDRVTVSLDSLDDDVFQSMNDVRFPVARVLDGIEAAQQAGLSVKVNMVVKRNVNDGSVMDMAERFRGTGIILRFIEFMDVGTTNGWRLDDVVPAQELVDRLSARWPLEPVAPRYPGEVANRLRYVDGAGEIGVIASVTRPFCGDLHPRPPVGRGRALHLPVRRPRPRPARPAARRRDRRAAGRAAGPDLGQPRRPLLGAAQRRDPRPPARRDVPHRRLNDRARAAARSAHIGYHPPMATLASARTRERCGVASASQGVA